MKNKKGLLIIMIVLAALIIGASLLYGKLAETEKPDQLMIIDPSAAESTAEPTDEPTVEPSPEPTDVPTAEPSAEPTDEPTAEPSAEPTEEPTPETTVAATPEATAEPTAEPVSEEEAELRTVPAFDFTVYDAQGNEVTLSQFFGKPIVLNYWASWCEPCQYEMPDFQKKFDELGDEVHFVMVNITDGGRETQARATSFLEKNGYTLPVYFDLKMDATRSYGVYSYPTTFFINAEGHVVAMANGMLNEALLDQGISMIR